MYKALYKDAVVAVKQLKNVEALFQAQRDEFIREVTLLKKIHDPHIV